MKNRTEWREAIGITEERADGDNRGNRSTECITYMLYIMYVVM